MKSTNENISKIVTLLIVIMPILEEYYLLNVPGSIADLILSILFIVLLFMTGIKGKIILSELCPEFTFYVLYVFLSMIIFVGQDFSLMTDNIRHIMIYVFVILWIKKYFNFSLALDALNKISFFLCIYCLIQYVGIKILGIYIPSYLPFFQHREDLIYESEYLNYSSHYRPHSIFAEPSHFCAYILLTLICILFVDMKQEKKMAISIFYTIVLFLTGSTTGIVGAALIWGLGITLHKKTGLKLKFNIFILLVLIVIPIIVGVTQSSTFTIFVNRFFVNQSSITLRIGTLPTLFLRSHVNILFGSGLDYDSFKETADFLPGFGACFAYFGLFGLILISFALIKIFLKTQVWFQRVVLIYIFCAFCFLDSMFNVNGLLLYAFAITGNLIKEKSYLDNKPQRRLIKWKKGTT